LLPFLQSAGIEGEPARKLGPAETRACPHSSHVHIEREGELMRGGRLRFALGDCGGFAHGFD
jgi:hypothetical protein